MSINKGVCPGNTSSGFLCEGGPNCPRPILKVLNDTLNDPSFKGPNSIVLIFTQSGAMDYGILDEVIDNANKKRTTVGFQSEPSS